MWTFVSSSNIHQTDHLGRYWLGLSLVFLSELFLDQLNLSPSLTLLKLAFMFWCVAPWQYNGSHLIYDKVA